MGCGIGKEDRSHGGGVVELAKFIDNHRDAIEHDIITKTGKTVEETVRTLGWGALFAVIQHVGPESALIQEVEPELSLWTQRFKTNTILADIYDILAQINANIVAIGSGEKAIRPTPYPRHWAKSEDKNRIGKGALPPKELEEWFEMKRRSC